MLIVRNMAESDIDAIAVLEEKNFSDAWSTKGIRETFEQSQAFIVVAEKDKKVVGYCIVYFVLDEGEIARIAVDDACRRQGVGRKLLEQVEKICKAKNIVRLMLDVRESNETARRFYLNLGFTEDGLRKNFYSLPEENAVLMSKLMNASGMNKD